MSRPYPLAALLVLVACGGANPPAPSPVAATIPSAAAPAPAPVAHVNAAEDMTAVGATLDRFHAAAASANEEAYFALFAEGGVFLGTDAKERWTVPQFRAYAHPRFAAGKAWSFRSVYREITVHGETAWFDELLDTPNLGPSRGSGVLVRDPKGEWKVAQYNLSVPIPNERFADVKKVIEGGAIPPAPVPVPAPLPASSAGRTDPPICVKARQARARVSPAAPALEAQCRSQGGTP